MNPHRRLLLDTRQVASLLEDLAGQIRSACPDTAPLVLGIHRGGVWLAGALHAALELQEAMGTLDIAFYRDDASTRRLNPQVQPSKLPVPVDGRDVLLVDDVLFTGRTIRAALNEIFDYGRPASVRLAVLIERSGRQLPIRADFHGLELDLPATDQARLERAAAGLEVWLESDAGREDKPGES